MAAPQRQIDRLLAVAARNNRLIKKTVELDGEDFTFWHHPMKMEEYQDAKSSSKNPEDTLELAVRLFVKKALDANGHQQYQSDVIPVLMKALPFELAGKLIGALQSDEEEEIELDMKSDKGTAKTNARANE